MKPSEGPERILLGFIIVYWNKLNRPRHHHHHHQKEKAVFNPKKKKERKKS